MVYLVEMRLELLYISWRLLTETFWKGNFFKPLYRLLNSSVFLLITNSPNQLVTLITISHGIDAMHFSRLFFFVLEFFAWYIVIFQEWKQVIIIWEQPSSALRKNIWYWLSETFPRHIVTRQIVTRQYMELVVRRKWWRKVNIKGLNFVFRQYLFFISNFWN